MFRFTLAIASLLLIASAAPRPQVFGHFHHDLVLTEKYKPLQKNHVLVLTKITNQSHEEALAAHQAAENAVRAAAGQVQ